MSNKGNYLRYKPTLRLVLHYMYMFHISLTFFLMLQWMYTVSHVIYISVTYSSHIGYGHHFFEMIA